MPIYPFRCPDHDEKAEANLLVADRDDIAKYPRCPVCDRPMARYLTVFGVSGLPTTK